jgi:CRP-like cAMP-binding protein
MRTLVKTLLLFDRLTEQQTKLISDITREIRLQEGEYFAEPGDVCSQLAFVEKGVLRYNHYNRRAENITSGLIGEGNFVAGPATLDLPAIQADYLQAITDCILSVIDKKGMDKLSATVSNWDSMIKSISQKATAEKRSRILRAAEGTDPEITAIRYLARFPNLGKHITTDQMVSYMETQVNHEK